jgi:hypothetical protein
MGGVKSSAVRPCLRPRPQPTPTEEDRTSDTSTNWEGGRARRCGPQRRVVPNTHSCQTRRGLSRRFGIPRRRSTFRTRSHERLTKPGGPFRQRPWVRDPCPPTMPRLARRPRALASRARREVVNTRRRRDVAGAAHFPVADRASTCHDPEDRASGVVETTGPGAQSSTLHRSHHPHPTTRCPPFRCPPRRRCQPGRGQDAGAGAARRTRQSRTLRAVDETWQALRTTCPHRAGACHAREDRSVGPVTTR